MNTDYVYSHAKFAEINAATSVDLRNETTRSGTLEFVEVILCSPGRCDKADNGQ